MLVFFFHASVDPKVLIGCSPALGTMDSTLKQNPVPALLGQGISVENKQHYTRWGSCAVIDEVHANLGIVSGTNPNR